MAVLMTFATKLANFFKDEKGNIVVAQWPNTPLWMTIAFVMVKYVPVPYADSISFWGVLVSLSYWAYLEIRFGDSGFRKLLGLVVALMQLNKLIQLWM